MAATGFSKDSSQLLKHHGTYQQDDRDERAAARKAGDGGKAYSFMVRTRVPGGKLTSRQLLAGTGPVRRIGQHDAADHQPPGLAAARDPERQSAARRSAASTRSS